MSLHRYAVVRGGVVIAAFMWDAELFPDYMYPDEFDQVIQHDEAGTGWTLVGGVLTDPLPPEPPPEPGVDDLFPPLEPWRFWAVVELPGSVGEANLRGAINAHPDPVFNAIAKAKLNNPPGGKFFRSDPLFSDATLLGAMSITGAHINALWMQAWELPA